MVWATSWKWKSNDRRENFFETFDQTSIRTDIYDSDGGDDSAVHSAQ